MPLLSHILSLDVYRVKLILKSLEKYRITKRFSQLYIVPYSIICLFLLEQKQLQQVYFFFSTKLMDPGKKKNPSDSLARAYVYLGMAKKNRTDGKGLQILERQTSKTIPQPQFLIKQSKRLKYPVSFLIKNLIWIPQ